jgi:hypothetical protein
VSLRLKDAFRKVLNVILGARLLSKKCPFIRGDDGGVIFRTDLPAQSR